MEEMVNTNELTDLIRKFPKNENITLIVYDDDFVAEAGYEIAMHWGTEYLDKYVTIATYKGDYDYKPDGLVYIDPRVLKYKAQWQD